MLRGFAAASVLLFTIPGCGGGDSADEAANQKKAPAGAQKKAGGKKGNFKKGGKKGPGGGPGAGGQPTPVAVETVMRGSIASYYTATATLEPNKEAEILARVSGVILAIEGEEGDRVSEGKTLLSIDDKEFQYRVKQAKAEYEKQQTRFARMQKMFEGNLASAEEFDTAKNDLQAAEAAAELAELELSYTRVRAPFTGHITRRHVDPGQTVSNNTPLYSISDLERLLARVFVPAKEFRSIQADQPVELVLDSTKDRLQGRIKLVSPIIDPQSGTIKLTVEVMKYPPNTRPGDFAEVRIVTDQHDQALVVPRTAIISERGEFIAYVAADSTAERRVVQTGFEDDRHIEVVAGLTEGEQVVVQGQRSLKDGVPIKIMDAIVFDDSPDRSGDS
jgi:membrane fusion protein (multidrug efflux system)